MSYQKNHSGEPIDVEYTEVIQTSCPQQRSFREWILGVPPGYFEPRQIRADRDRARLAANALRNIAGLSALEAQAMVVAPQSAEQYRQIIDTYTEVVVDAIRKGQRGR